ncbi:MAG: AAA family ATPase [Patescibacteria group bacterium]
MKPTCIAIAGIPTSGKTTLGCALSAATGIRFIDSNEFARFAPMADPATFQTDEGRERERARMRIIYALTHAVAGAYLEGGESIIIAATYSKEASQLRMSDTVLRTDARLRILWCQYDTWNEAEVERRLADRATRNDLAAGEIAITPEYLREQIGRTADIKLAHLVVRMEGGDEGTRAAVEAALQYINAE